MGDGIVRVGTSGWQYDDWRGAFYPDTVPKRRWFEYYASRFPTVEINATFYRLPRTATVQRWHDRAPDRFRFAVKGSRYITHNRKLNDPADPVETVTTRLAPLKTFHGVWLWQLPPTLHIDVERLDTFAAALPGAHRHAVEFRHRSWYTDEVERALARHGIAWVWLSDHQMPAACPVTGDFVYLRFHGLSGEDDQRYRYDYAEAELAPWVERLRAAATDGCDAWVYFNNDHRANAPRNATTLIDMLDDIALRCAGRGGAAIGEAILVRVDQIFTVDEARATLAEQQPSIDAFLLQRADFAELRWALEHDAPTALGGVAELKALEARLDRFLSSMRDRGIHVKGIAPLLLDFSAVIDGQTVLLCWLEGEPRLGWFHPIELGLMGRRRL